MPRIQDFKDAPTGWTPAGMPSLFGGLAGLEEDVGDLEAFPSLGQDATDGGATADAGGLPTDTGQLLDIFSADAPQVTAQAPDAAQGAVPPSPAAAGAQTDPSTGTLTVDGFEYSAPGGAAPGVDPGWAQIGGVWWYVYANGDRISTAGTYVYPDGTYITPDGYQVNPDGSVIGPGGQTTAATAKKPPAADAGGNGISGSSIVSFVKGLLAKLSGPAAPAGVGAGQVFRAANGSYYRLNADGTTTLVPSPYSAGLLGGGSGVLLIGAAVVAFLVLRKRGA
jgi:hypothetical protein